ncbi:MAG: hypothetical protein Q7R85_00095 [bacterium]|nr:hypothetical protein [bacterium]
MDTLYRLLTPFGQTVVGLALLVLAMSGIYYWCQRAHWWLYKRQNSLQHMTHEELHAYVGNIMSPPDVLLKGAQLQGDLDAIACVHNLRIGTMLESSICAYGGVDEKDASVVADMIAGALRVKTIAVEEFDGETRRELIAALKRILDCRPGGSDDTAELMQYWLSILAAAERLEQHRIANSKK